MKNVVIDWMFAAGTTTGQSITQFVENMRNSPLAKKLYETHAYKDLMETTALIKNDPVGYASKVGSEVIRKITEEGTALIQEVSEHPVKGALVIASTFAVIFAYKAAARMLTTVNQSFDDNIINVDDKQSEFLQLVSNQYEAHPMRAKLSNGESIDYAAISGTSWNYAPRMIKGRKVLLKFSTLDALELAINSKKPKNYNANNFARAQVVEWPQDGNLVARMKRDAELSSNYGLLAGNLVKSEIPDGYRYQSPDFQIDLKLAGGEVNVEVNYRELAKPKNTAATSVAYCPATNLYFKENVTELVKGGNWDSVVAGFVMLMQLDAKSRKTFINQYFKRDSARTFSLGYVEGERSDRDLKEFKPGEFIKLLRAFASPLAAGSYLADRTVQRIFKLPVPTALRKLVNRKPLSSGKHLMWEAQDGVFHDSQPMALPLSLQKLPVGDHGRVHEFLNLKATSPRNDIYDQTDWAQHGVARLKSAFGITGIKRSDKANVAYFIYNPNHLFSSQAGAAKTDEGRLVSGAMRNYLATGGKVDELAAVFEIMEHGTKMLRIDSRGNVDVAPVIGNFDMATLRFIADAANINWTRLTPAKADQKLEAVRLSTNLADLAKIAAATPA